MGAKEFDYYIFIDYSENLIGYVILSKEQIKECMPRISKFKHYKELKNKGLYLKSMKNLFEKNNLLKGLLGHRITELRQNIELCSEVLDFCKNKPESNIFISVDDRQYEGFMKLIKIIEGKRLTIIREGKLKRHTIEYKSSLIIDTLLNIKRMKK